MRTIYERMQEEFEVYHSDAGYDDRPYVITEHGDKLKGLFPVAANHSYGYKSVEAHTDIADINRVLEVLEALPINTWVMFPDSWDTEYRFVKVSRSEWEFVEYT